MKLSLQTLDHLLESCTGKEIDLAIYLGQFMDATGVVGGIYYKNVVEDIGMSESAFYKCLYALEAKGIIKISMENEHSYWAVQFIDSSFTCVEDYRRGYLNLNYEILHTKSFRKLTRSEKVIILRVLKLMGFHIKHKRTIMPLLITTLMDWTGKSRRAVIGMVENLAKLLKLCISGYGKGAKALIDLRHRLCNRRNVNEADMRNAHILDYILRTTDTHASNKDFHDTIGVFKWQKVNCFDMVRKILRAGIAACGYLAPAWVQNFVRQLKQDGVIQSTSPNPR